VRKSYGILCLVRDRACRGDFYQLSPVFGGPIYGDEAKDHDKNTDRKAHKSKRKPTLETMDGQRLWKQFITVGIELIENKRSDDAKFTERLQRFRIGQPNDDDLDAIGKRVVGVTNRLELPPNTTLTVPTNSQRRTGNMLIVRGVLQSRAVSASTPDAVLPTWRARGVLLVEGAAIPRSATDETLASIFRDW
jgi:hypothetical protein